ncbi:hypothetical protein BDF20DRAFT_881480 [Mycotypha africana]|uniref:uncharacterized protein n=1 Tax=Mycotypha africana TaxID=64632 RepID=UPI002300E5BC|nr:uncharacterized protein BDF20DRAFT_881480 [Mycotypha africana]KAI8973274.1 hypothetical protein BDF20DRAFT_881480 [Mycotypha africana]
MRTYEDALISEMQSLVENINKINAAVLKVNEGEVVDMVDKLRKVEQKMSLVFTFFKASMFANKFYEKEESTNRPSF